MRRRLEAAGFVIVGQKGSHDKFIKHSADKTLMAIVPEHREITLGTLRSILRQAGLSVDKFARMSNFTQ